MGPIVVKDSEGQRIDVSRNAKPEHQHQECSTKHGEPESDRIAHQFQCLADRAG